MIKIGKLSIGATLLFNPRPQSSFPNCPGDVLLALWWVGVGSDPDHPLSFLVLSLQSLLFWNNSFLGLLWLTFLKSSGQVFSWNVPQFGLSWCFPVVKIWAVRFGQNHSSPAVPFPGQVITRHVMSACPIPGDVTFDHWVKVDKVPLSPFLYLICILRGDIPGPCEYPVTLLKLPPKRFSPCWWFLPKSIISMVVAKWRFF